MRKINRKNAKRDARKVIKSHYWILVVTCLMAAVLGTGFSDSLGFLDARVWTEAEKEEAIVTTYGSGAMLDAFIEGQSERYDKISEQIDQNEKTKGFNIGLLQVGRNKGILASLVNKINSGTLLVTLMNMVRNITGSTALAFTLMIVLAALFYLAFWAMIANVYKVVYSRIFLEARIYEKIPAHRILFLQRIKCWMRASRAMLKYALYLMFWGFTIIGGVIKHYSYALVPMILAENPKLTGSQAITLSRKMMKGHKWQFFVADLSFILWDILGNITLGLANVFYVNSYRTATFTELYVQLREDWIANQSEGYELLDDVYLYQLAGSEKIMEAYADVKDIKAPEKIHFHAKYKVTEFFANIFGLVLYYNDEEEAYRQQLVTAENARTFKDVLAGKTYPTRLSTYPDKKKVKSLQDMNYARCYSVTSVIMMFFILSFVGWSWEVSLHLVQDGVFVNRGVMHGPWLPIYGTGGIMILILLNKFRNRPWLEFFLGIILAGIAEYTTSWYLQMVHNGKKWWDYSGYFLNLNGRVCAEGLLVFGLGGVAAVYLLAPALDNLIRKINLKVLIVVCAVLLAIFFADSAYSKVHPNEGKGITDYAAVQQEMRLTDSTQYSAF